jgi:hypothetical protein
MRRREKFVLSSIFLSLVLLSVQYVPLDFRYPLLCVFAALTYIVSAWALSDDLQRTEWLTILPLPTLYAGAVGAFYFLLPEGLWSRFFNLGLFGIGMYALFLTANIYSVAKGRTIQLLRAAHAIGLLFTLLTSLLFLNTLFSHRLPFYFNGLGVGLTHLPLIFLFLWAVRLEPKFDPRIIHITVIFTLFMVELGIIFSFLPMTVWHVSLFLMTFLYIILGILQAYFQDRFFQSTVVEYTGVGVFLGFLFFVLLPWK